MDKGLVLRVAGDVEFEAVITGIRDCTSSGKGVGYAVE